MRRQGHRVLVSHPERDDVRPCRLAVAAGGIVLSAERRPGARREPAPLRVPWWAIEGLSADGSALAPDGRRLQVLALVTDAGTLELLCPCGEIAPLLAALGGRARRWRLARLAPLREAARLAVLGTSATTRLAEPARRATARLRPSPRLGALASAARGPLAPVGRVVGRRPVAVVSVAAALCLWIAVAVQAPPSPPAVAAPRPPAAPGRPAFDASGMAQILTAARFQAGAASHLAPATAPPPPAPPAVADAAPLGSHEVLGFAPYWTLATQAQFDVAGYTTIAYFAVAVNANGTLQESGTGWDGYQSQAFADLVARAHAAGDRVVLTVNCFAQSALDQVTSSPTAATTLAAAVVGAIAAKNLDGVNIDFEGEGSADQAGLSALVGTVSHAVHAANPHYQVTMDTYASSAGDPRGFYDIPALAPEVDGFFVMSYNLNLAATASAASPVTSAELSDAAAAAQYAAVVPPSEVIWGTSYFGYTWATTTGTMAATAMGTGVPVSYAQVMASGHPIYWDPVTDTAWTSFETGTQWYETYVEDPASIYLVAKLAAGKGFAGVGVWAMGMEGDAPQMTAALDGNAPPERAGPAGPAVTSQSPGAGAGTATTIPALTVLTGLPALGGAPTTTTAPPEGTTGTTPGTGQGTTTTTTAGNPTPSYRYAGTWKGQTVSLTRIGATAVPPGTGTAVGTLSGFTTTDPALSCLAAQGAPPLAVLSYPGSALYVVTARLPTDCVAAQLTFPATASTVGPASTGTPSATRATGGATPATG